MTDYAWGSGTEPRWLKLQARTGFKTRFSLISITNMKKGILSSYQATNIKLPYWWSYLPDISTQRAIFIDLVWRSLQLALTLPQLYMTKLTNPDICNYTNVLNFVTASRKFWNQAVMTVTMLLLHLPPTRWNLKIERLLLTLALL